VLFLLERVKMKNLFWRLQIGTFNRRRWYCLIDFHQYYYDFFLYPQYLLLAAVFGYVPSLVISILKQQAHKIQGELLGSSPGNEQDHLSD